MRLKEIFIRRYGPISNLHMPLPTGLQPIYGLNESGKTLVIDALLKKLLGLEVGSDPSLDRVEETPEGYIVLEDEGQEIKLEENETLATHLAIEADELRNIFIVRDADLRIESEDIFYKRVTDKITGLRLEDIRRIKEQLEDLGRLTGSWRLSNSSNFFKAKTQLESARELKQEAKDYLEKAESEELQKLEANIVEARIEKARLKSRLELLEKAKKKDEFEKLDDALQSAKSILSDLSEIPEKSFHSLGERLTLYEASEDELPHLHRSNEYFKRFSYISAVGTFATFIILYVLDRLAAFNLIFPSLLLLLTIVFMILGLNASRRLSGIEGNQTLILREGTTLGLEVKDVSALRRALKESDTTVKTLRGDLNQKLGVLKKDLNIKLEAPSEILKEAAAKLDKIEGEIDQTIKIGYDQEEHDEANQKIDEIDEKLNDLENSLTKHSEALANFSDRAHKLNFQAFLDRELDLEIKNLDSLNQLIPQLDEFQSRIEEDAEIAVDALELFNKIEKEEKAKVATIFEKGNLASQLFSKTTHGRYSDVEYDYENERIIVRRPTDETFSPEGLSRGARDQLYLSIRVALGQMLLEGKMGFFIMDDAFISSDDNRIKEQRDLLKNLAKMGWQTIYFSARKGTIEMLSRATKNKTITLEPLP